MLKYTDYDIVFREIPNEVTLAINLSNCPHRCVGCHSPQLQQDIGEELNEKSLEKIIKNYDNFITCVCFMGGDSSPAEIGKLADFVKNKWNQKLKIGWYSGNDKVSNLVSVKNLNFVKLGEYKHQLGGLDCKTTNQRLYSIDNLKFNDITFKLQKK